MIAVFDEDMVAVDGIEVGRIFVNLAKMPPSRGDSLDGYCRTGGRTKNVYYLP